MRFTSHWPVRYGLAVLATLVAVFLRWVLEPLIGTSVAFITVFPAMMLVAVKLGAGPGLLSSTLGIVLIEWFFIGPTGIEVDLAFVARAAILISTSAYVGRVSAQLRRARAEADTKAAAARAAETALRQQVELLDPVRAELIVSEMQRLVRDRERADSTSALPDKDWLRHMPTLAGAALAVISVSVLLGWSFDRDELKSILTGFEAMKVNTALCFLLAGLGLILRDRRGPRLACAGLLSALAGVTLAEYATGLSFGIDQLLFSDTPVAHTLYPGRMVHITAACFVLSGAALLLLTVRRGRWAQQALSLTVGILGLSGLLGYAYDVKALYQFTGHTGIALHTAAGLVVLATGLLFARPDGMASILTGAGPGAQLARRFLPVAILLPLALGWLQELGNRTGLTEPGLSAGLFTLATMVSLLAGVWWIAWALNRADAARRETEAQLRHQSELMNHADEGLIVRELGGVIRFWNQGAATLYGWSAAEAIGQRTFALLRTEGVAVAEKDEQLTRTGHWEGELTHTARDGRRVIIESRQTATHAADGHLLILESDRDITERKRIEREREITVKLLRLVNLSQDIRHLAQVVVAFFQEQSGCEAVGLRLREGEDYPYFETHGFPPEFVLIESRLCACDDAGRIVRGPDGNALIECMCGNIICGRFNPSLPFFSEHGSFWTNSTTALLASTTAGERQARTRNRCNGEGYESVALLPLCVGTERIGLIQLNDRRRDRFSAETIALWERLANHVAIGLAKLRAETALRESELLHLQTLEQRVRERTGELEATNRELEAFCYSVSHDLRTPLRTIDGFSQAVLEDYGTLLDATGLDFLNRVRAGCQQMDQLIDALLNLSHVTRDPMRREPVDLTALAQAVVNQLREGSPGRKVDVRIAPGLTAVGDARLLRAALFNLLANAWKFSLPNPAAVIEVGTTMPPSALSQPSRVFFVRDNGVGFDMQYAGKLFNAFQRLHTVKEFPGTGIGLATVARVIQRHGGRIWADAAVGRGATFYFTLESEPAVPPH